MAHLFVLCGPPGSGKTTLLKMVKDRRPDLKHLRRFSTRPPRPEEGDRGHENLEYSFLSLEEFASHLVRFEVANFIEWSGNFYSTDVEPIRKALESNEDHILYEDMPSAVHLKRIFGSSITVIMLFPGDEEQLRHLEFATVLSSTSSCVVEWERRLGAKYAADAAQKNETPTEDKRVDYTRKKMSRAMMDLAFMAGRIQKKENIRVLANKTDKQEEMFRDFIAIVDQAAEARARVKRSVFVLMRFEDDFNKLYRFVIKTVVEKFGLECLRGDETSSHLKVVDDIVHHIEMADLIIADITGGNPNVFLELGISLTLNKPLILITQDDKQPFDVDMYRWIHYKNDLAGWTKLTEDISEAIRKTRAPL